MMLCSMTTFISCSDISDNPVIDPNPLASIIGSKTWWADYKLDGEYVWSKDDIDPYSRIIETYSFSTDGSGVWNRFYLKDDESEPFALSGGKSYCGFHYTSTADGLITITIDEKVAKSEPFPQSWTVRYEDEAICFTDTKGQQHQSREASDDELEYLHKSMTESNDLKIVARMKAIQSLSETNIKKQEEKLLEADEREKEKIIKAIEKEKKKTKEKLEMLEKKRHLTYSSSLQGLCLLEVI